MIRGFSLIAIVGVALVAPTTSAQTLEPPSRPAPAEDDIGRAMSAIEEWTGVFRVTFAHSGSNPDDRESKRNIRGSARMQATGVFRIGYRGESGWDGKVVTTMEANHEGGQEAWKPVLPDGGEGFFDLNPDQGADVRPWHKFGTEREFQSGSSPGEGFLTLEIKDGSYRIRSGATCRTQLVRDDVFEGYGSQTPSGEIARRAHGQTSALHFSVIGALPASSALRDGLSGSMECPVMVTSGQEDHFNAWFDSFASVQLAQELWLYQNSPDLPKAKVEWNLRPAPPIQVRFRTGGGATGSAGVWKPAEDFVDFLVGKGQPPIDVRITTWPNDSPVRWQLEPRGEHCGTVSPNTGTDREFSFSPRMPRTPPRTPPETGGGSKRPNAPVGYRLTVWALDGFGAGVQKTIEQDVVSVLRQEYVDYGWIPPDRAKVGDVPTVPGWLKIPDRSAMFGNYSEDYNVTLNGGWFDLVNDTYGRFGAQIEINSAYRNPQRNRGIRPPGTPRSIHQMAGAVDMDPVPDNTPQTPEALVKLYHSALATLESGAENVFLEKQADGIPGGVVLLPKNWKPPPANHRFEIGDATVVVEDSDRDDLPDRVVSAHFTETRLNIYTLLPYPEGGGDSQPSFVVIDYNNSKRIDAGDGLELVYKAHPNGNPRQEWIPAEEIGPIGPPPQGDILQNARWRWRCRPLRWYFEQASHVHCDNGKRPDPLQGP